MATLGAKCALQGVVRDERCLSLLHEGSVDASTVAAKQQMSEKKDFRTFLKSVTSVTL
jgi:hypothetical protein